MRRSPLISLKDLKEQKWNLVNKGPSSNGGFLFTCLSTRVPVPYYYEMREKQHVTLMRREREAPHTRQCIGGDFLRILSVPLMLTDGVGLLREIMTMAVNWIRMLPPNRDTRQDLSFEGISLVSFICHYHFARISCLQVADNFWASLEAVILRGKTGTYAYRKTSIILSRRLRERRDSSPI